MTAPLLQVEGLTVRFGGLTAVDDVSFNVAAGAIVSVIGPNGAGKTSLFNAITGIHPASTGTVRLAGRLLAEPVTWRVVARWLLVAVATGLGTALGAEILAAWAAFTADEPAPFTWSHGAAAAVLVLWSSTLSWWAGLIGMIVGFSGASVNWWRARRRCELACAAGLGRTFQNIRLFRDLSVLDNVRIGAHRHLRGGGIAAALRLPRHFADEHAATAAARAALAVVGLTEVAQRPAGSLPYGHQRRLEIARALATKPRLLLLDEPAAGMNPSEADALTELIRTIRDQGITVLLIEHHMRVVMAVSDQVVVLQHGRVLAQGTPAAVQADPRVVAAYLGGGVAATVAAAALPPAVVAPVLTLSGIKAHYGPIQVLHGVDLTVNAGEVVCLLGGNGAGKTTTLLCVAGVHHASAGRVTFLGQDATHASAHRNAAAGLVLVPEGRRIFANLSVAENLRMGAFLRRDAAQVARDLERVYALFPVLADRRRQSGGTLSGGEQQMLAIGRALLTAPKLLLLDEPSMGVAPQVVERLALVIRQLAADGLPILLVEQDAHLALSLASRGYVLETGHLVLSGSAADLHQDPRVREAYLGA